MKQLDSLITVYIPTHNRLELLRRAVDSVLEQDYPNVELIVVDDGSEDGTQKYLQEMMDLGLLFFYRNEVSMGACHARNLAIFSAKGEFITGLDDDDYFLVSHLSSLIDFWFNCSERIVAVYPENLMFCDGKITKSGKRLKFCSRENLVYGNWIGNQVFTKTEALKAIGGFDESFPAWQDYECWYRLLSLKGGLSACSGSYTYVQDSSHSYGRISSGSLDRVLEAFEAFADKHSLSMEQKEVVKLNLVAYGVRNVRLIYFLIRFFGMPNYNNFRSTLAIFLRHIRIL